jgi:hypothetical protein
MPVKRIDMALHIQELCAEHGITVRYQSLSDSNPRYYARPSDRLIQIRPTKNTGYYVSALHELGHILGRFQSWEKSRLTRELWAWVWARQNALVWTETADRIMRQAMDSYGWTSTQKNRWAELFPVDNCEQSANL